MSSPSDAQDQDARRARYTYGHGAAVVDVHNRRTAEREAEFVLPHLAAGMRVLDAGCGPGSITVGLAQVVSPGAVVGVDVAESVLVRGRALAAAHGVANVRFQQADARHLPFPDASFDAVFAHTLLEHVPDPPAVLAELTRVLRPGGLIALRDCDWASGIVAPTDPAVEQAMTLYARIWQSNGGHPRCGRELRGWLRSAGVQSISTSASFRWDGSLAESRAFGELLATRFALPEFIAPALAHGWADPATLAHLAAACRAWSERPDIFAAMTMCEAVAWKS